MLMTRTAPRRGLGKVLAGLTGVTDPGQPPALPAYLERTDPSPTSPYPDPVPMRPGAAILHSITANGNANPASNGGMARWQMPDGSVRGEKLPIDASGQSIVATPEQEAESAEVARRLGSPPDYAAILRGALGERPKMNTLQTIASIAGPVLMSLSGDQAAAMQLVGQVGARGREWDERAREADLTAAKWTRDDDVAERERNEPRFFASGRDQVRYDPASGQSSVIYDGSEDWQDYAAGLGFEPGSEGYNDAARDYVLRSNGPSAFKSLQAAEAMRQANRIAIERTRQANRAALKGVPTYRDKNPLPRASGGVSRQSVVTVSTPAEAMKLAPGTKFRTQIGGKWVTKVRP